MIQLIPVFVDGHHENIKSGNTMINAEKKLEEMSVQWRSDLARCAIPGSGTGILVIWCTGNLRVVDKKSKNGW